MWENAAMCRTEEVPAMRVPAAAFMFAFTLMACRDDLAPPPQAPGEVADVAVVHEHGPHLAQCAPPATTLPQSAAKLSLAGVQVLRSSCGIQTGVFHPTVCGAGTGEIIVHNIPMPQLSAARAAGFQPTAMLVDVARGTGWARFRCEGYQAFRDVALQTSGCAQTRNRLLRIDHQTQGTTDLILLDQAGTCADAAYQQVLYGASPGDVLCSNVQTIAGPVKNCPAAQYAGLFDTIIDNLDKTDLGLGPDYRIQEIIQ